MSERVTWQEKIAAVGWPFWAGVVFFFWVIIGLVWLIEYVGNWLIDENQLPVKEIVVHGTQNYVVKKDVINALESQMQQSFFTLDVNQAQLHLESLAWVYSASVRKEWPNRLKIYLTEQKPVAHWNGDFFINEFGDVFQAEQDRLLQPLSWLYGPEGDEKSALNTYTQLAELMKLYDIDMTELSLSERHALSITLANGVKLRLGREDWLNRSKRFLQHYQMLMQKHELAYVDLRYDTGFAIGVKHENNK